MTIWTDVRGLGLSIPRQNDTLMDEHIKSGSVERRLAHLLHKKELGRRKTERNLFQFVAGLATFLLWGWWLKLKSITILKRINKCYDQNRDLIHADCTSL